MPGSSPRRPISHKAHPRPEFTCFAAQVSWRGWRTEIEFESVDYLAIGVFTRRMWRGGRIAPEEVPPLLIRSERPGVFRDTLRFSSGSQLFVSERLRAFLESEAGDQLQFFPARLQGPGSRAAPSRYWLVHCMLLIDCFDEVSFNYYPDNGERYVEVPVIDSRRVPPSARIFMCKYQENYRLIRRDLRLKLQRTDFTGLQFSPIRDIVQPGAVDFVKPDYTRKDK